MICERCGRMIAEPVPEFCLCGMALRVPQPWEMTRTQPPMLQAVEQDDPALAPPPPWFGVEDGSATSPYASIAPDVIGPPPPPPAFARPGSGPVLRQRVILAGSVALLGIGLLFGLARVSTIFAHQANVAAPTATITSQTAAPPAAPAPHVVPTHVPTRHPTPTPTSNQNDGDSLVHGNAGLM